MADPHRRYPSVEKDARSAVPGYMLPGSPAASHSGVPGYMLSDAPSTASHHDVPSYKLSGSASAALHHAVPSYKLSDVRSTTSHQMWGMSDSRGTPDLPRNDMLSSQSGSYRLDDCAGIMGSHLTTRPSALAAGDSIRAFSPLEDPALVRGDAPVDFNHNIAADGLLLEESNILFVDCLPTDCTRREISHLFRPFIGFKEIRAVHKEPRQIGDKAKVLCFVEFDNAKCALTALEALQGYKFDDKKPNAPVLRIQLIKFPFHPPY